MSPEEHEIAAAARADAWEAIGWWIIWVAVASLALVIIIVIMTKPQPDMTTICRHWDGSNAVMAERDGDGFNYRDTNGLNRRITGAESDLWNCDK